MSKKQDFTLFKRKLRNGKIIYYYCVYDRTGKRKQYSTGKTDQLEAYKYCLELLKKDRLVPDNLRILKEFTEDFFIYEKCPYIQSKINKGYKYSRSNADRNRSILLTHIWPFFGELSMERILVLDIENWLLKTKKKGFSNISINKHLTLLALILNEAVRLGIISENPAKKVRKFKNDSPEKGILEEKEWESLFDKVNKSHLWGGESIGFIFNYTASVTGLRIGELQALRRENIFKDHILVKYSWDPKYGLKETKTGKERFVPINSDLYNLLKSETLSPFGYIFSNTNGRTPVTRKTVYSAFHTAMSNNHIETKKRNITFHSWRHYFNTRLKAKGVPQNIVQAITGHSSREMSEHYTHYSLEDLKVII